MDKVFYNHKPLTAGSSVSDFGLSGVPDTRNTSSEPKHTICARQQQFVLGYIAVPRSRILLKPFYEPGVDVFQILGCLGS